MKSNNTPDALEPSTLYTACNLDELAFDTTAELEEIDLVAGQQRALDSVKFGMGMHGDGYNVFALGPSGMGKFTVISHILEVEAVVGHCPTIGVISITSSSRTGRKLCNCQPGEGLNFNVK